MFIEEIFQDCDFTDLTFDNYQSKILDKIPKKYQYNFFISRSKLLIEFFEYKDFIVKIFLVDSSAPKLVQNIYLKAKEQHLEQFFAEYKPFSKTQKGFYQPKVEVAQHGTIVFQPLENEVLVKELLQKTLLTDSLYQDLFFPVYYYKWIEEAIKIAGYDTVYRLLNFIKNNGIVDVFSPTNYGFLNGFPIIFDYDNCSRKKRYS